jgi:hypothetical protein
MDVSLNFYSRHFKRKEEFEESLRKKSSWAVGTKKKFTITRDKILSLYRYIVSIVDLPTQEGLCPKSLFANNKINDGNDITIKLRHTKLQD